MNLFDLYASLSLDSSKYNQGLAKSKQDAEQFSNSIAGILGGGLSKGFTNIGSALTNIGGAIENFGNNITKVGQAASVVTAGVSAVLGATFTKAKTFIGTYESAMVVFRRKLQGGEEEAKNMYNELVRIAKGSAYAQEHMISAGKTLVAMGNDFTKTSKYVQAATDAVAAFGGTGQDVEELAHRFGRMSQQTTLYTMDLNMLVDKGVPAWDILATKYKTTTEEVKKMAREGMLPAKKGLEILTDAMEETNEQSEMFKYSVAGMAKALKSGTLTGVLDSLNTSFRTFSLTLLQLDPREKTGIENIKKLNTAITKIGATLENIGKKLGNIVGKDLSNMFDRVSNALDNFNNRLDDMKPEQIEKLVHAIESVAVAGPILIVLGKIISTLGATIKAFGGLFTWLGGKIGSITSLFLKLVAVCGGVAPAFGVIVAAGTAIISVAVAIKRHWETVVKFFKSFKFGQTLDSIKKSAEKLIPKIKKLGDFFEVLGVAILAVLSPFIALGTYIVKVFMGAVDGAITHLGGLIDILSGIGNIIVGIFSGDADKIQEGFKNIWTGCISIAEGFVKTLISVFDPLGLLPNIFDPAISSTIEFSDTVSEESQKAIQAYMNLDRDATIALNDLYWSSTAITEDTKKEVCGKYDSMCNYIIQKIEEQKNKTLKVLQDMVNESETLNEDEKNSIIETTKQQFEEREKATTEANKRINEILSNASEERRQLTEEEKSEIGKLQEEMKTNAVAAISESQKEQLAILEDLKNNASKLSAEQCSEIIKNSIKQKDETIKNATDEYKERLKAAIDLRSDGSEESKKLSDKVIEEAERQKKEAIKKAEETHNQVVSEAQKQAKEHGEEINTETGEVLSQWDKFVKKLKPIFGDMSTMTEQELNEMGISLDEWTSDSISSLDEWNKDCETEMQGWNNLMWVNTDLSEAKKNVSDFTQGTSGDIFDWTQVTIKDIDNWDENTSKKILESIAASKKGISNWSDMTGKDISDWADNTSEDADRWKNNIVEISNLSEASKNISGFTDNTESEINEMLGITTGDMDNWYQSIYNGTDLSDPEQNVSNFTDNTGSELNNWLAQSAQKSSEWCDNVGKNISTWATNSWDRVSEWSSKTGKDISDWGTTTGSNISSWCSDRKQDMTDAWTNMKSTVSTKSGEIKSNLSSTFENMGSNIGKTWDNIKNTISTKIDEAKENIRKAIDKIKEFFSFQFSWPKIPLPHFSISPSGWKIGDLLQGSIPSLNVEWYAKGGIFKKPTLFPTANGFSGIGEAGAEAVLPIKLLREYIKDAMAEGVRETQVSYKDSYNGKANAGLVNGLLSAMQLDGNETTINLVVDGKTLAEVMYNPMSRLIQQKGVALNA